MGRVLSLWWIPFAAALAAVIGWETNWGESLYSPTVVAPAPQGKGVVSALLPEYKASPEPDAYAEVVERPLFSPTRRQAPPPLPPVIEPPRQVMQTGQYVLTGTMQAGDKLYAFLRENRTGKGLRAAQGDVLSSGITLAKVEPGRVVFTQYDNEEEVRLQVSKSTRPTPVAAAPAPGVPGAPPGMPGIPGMLTPQGGMVSAQPGQPMPAPQQNPGAPGGVAPTTMAPFVPGISAAPSAPQGTPMPPRRRGAMQ